ncbi:hypothetical protein IKT18_00870 [Candidatus Saccharibacteria bacterium]|nr:hypothetical protein [Candidatus Saccharibacteria bacterium]
MVLPIIGITVLSIAVIAGIIVAISRRKKVNRFTTHTNKHLVAKLTTLSVVVLLGALGVLNADKLTSMVNAADNSEEDMLTITASDIKIDVDLNDKAVFATGESVVTVDSATRGGYTLMAYVDNDATDLSNETNKSSKSSITMLDANLKTPKALEDNTWGMSTTKPSSQEDETFRGLPSTLDEAVTLKYTEEATEASDKTTVYYGTYVTPDIDYGTYSGVTITYIAIANFACNPDATTIQEAVCMQDFAGPNRDQIVNSMTSETQYTLIDKRDKKSYTIAKLKQYTPAGGGKSTRALKYGVWMTQNLDLDLDSNTTYTNEDTDLGYNPITQQYGTASWKPSRSTYTTAGTWGLFNQSAFDGNLPGGFAYPESYDPGDKYWTGRESNGNDWDTYYDTCSSNGPIPTDCDESINPTSSYISSTGIPQYHLGNYYNWTAAVAMNNSSNYFNGELIEQSICPAGWTLPRIGEIDDSFDSLWYENGFYDGGFVSYWYDSNNTLHALWKEPFYFTASGVYSGSSFDVGLTGSFWSAFVRSPLIAEDASFNVDGRANTSNGGYRYGGNVVRCVARPVTAGVQVFPIPIDTNT